MNTQESGFRRLPCIRQSSVQSLHRVAVSLFSATDVHGGVEVRMFHAPWCEYRYTDCSCISRHAGFDCGNNSHVGALRHSRSSFGVLVSPQDYKKLVELIPGKGAHNFPGACRPDNLEQSPILLSTLQNKVGVTSKQACSEAPSAGLLVVAGVQPHRHHDYSWPALTCSVTGVA